MHRRSSPDFVTERKVVQRDAIAAVATAAGESAIALIRISGLGAIALADAVFRGKTRPSQFPSHTQHLGQIVASGQIIDQVVLALHRSPKSYTGEDLVEITCHGGMLVTAKILEICLQAGARTAQPGEFTQRAYLNGKLDLTQAEAVIDLIRARTDLAVRSAAEQLSGRLGQQFRYLRQQLIEILAHVEADIDFPEEGILPDDAGTLEKKLHDLRSRMDELLCSASLGRILREGIRVVIFGPTNAGKSSLFNRLLGVDRAITSEIHGTTRDTIEESFDLRGIALRLLDTAGLRPPENEIEEEGIARTRSSLETADIQLHVVDGSEARPSDFAVGPHELLVLNKSDLPEHPDWRGNEAIRISCRSGAGFEALEEKLIEEIGAAKLDRDHPLTINARHSYYLRSAAEACERALNGMKSGITPEMVAIDLRDSERALDDLLGGGDEESVRNTIFSQFCIGK